ncbi:MAG: riboflavin synthase [Acidobacteriota bacterium]
MFTGIVEEVGSVVVCRNGQLEVSCQTVLSDMSLGASIAVNGVCLTAVEIRSDGFRADLAQETLDRTNLSDLRPGDPVNLERPLMLQTRLSGHIVQGHVDGAGILESRDEQGIAVRVPRDLDRFLVYKGSICLDGISLTIASVADGLVKVAIIPHTWGATNLHTRKPGDRINVECDILAKHVDRLLEGVTGHLRAT